MGDVIQPKMIYLTRRRATLSREEFTARWRRHALLGMSLPRWSNIARYVHCDVEEPVGSEAEFLDDYDGIGLIWYKSLSHRAAHVADVGSQMQMEDDEDQTFARRIAKDRFLTRESGQRPTMSHPMWKVTRFLDRVSEAPSLSHVVGYVRSTPLPPENETGWGLSYRMVEEFWFESRAAAVETAASLASDRAGATVLSNEVEIYAAAS